MYGINIIKQNFVSDKYNELYSKLYSPIYWYNLKKQNN